MKQNRMHGLTAVVLTALSLSAQAETITIGKGTGIVWEGLAFNHTLTGTLESRSLNPIYGLLSVSSDIRRCIPSSSLRMIGGYLALPLNGVPGVGLVPRASGTANYIRDNGARHSLTGTIGLPNTQGQSTSDGAVRSPSGREWCLPPAMTASNPYYSSSGARSATLAGTWALVADGTQQQGVGTVPPMYFGSYAAITSGDRWVQILPSSINLRISTLECTVNTPLDINFGSVNHDATVNAELGSRSYPLITTCGQPSNHINANINLQFRASSGIHASTTTRLALNEGGGFVTGEIDKGVTGSGACSGLTGIPFNNTPLKIGNITNVESSKTLDNQVTWRLCSGGNDMPIGKVTASAEMLVTFN